MIVITRYDSGFTVRGHADYAPPGQDIVCAGISTLLQAFLVSVEELTADKLKVNMAAGYAVIEHGNLSADAQLLVSSFFVGVQLIADSYPANVKLVRAVEDIKSNGIV